MGPLGNSARGGIQDTTGADCGLARISVEPRDVLRLHFDRISQRVERGHSITKRVGLPLDVVPCHRRRGVPHQYTDHLFMHAGITEQ